jgi:hypothetical protein
MGGYVPELRMRVDFVVLLALLAISPMSYGQTTEDASLELKKLPQVPVLKRNPRMLWSAVR